jgi:hypothetical protein
VDAPKNVARLINVVLKWIKAALPDFMLLDAFLDAVLPKSASYRLGVPGLPLNVGSKCLHL